MGADESPPSRGGGWWRRLDTWQQLAGILGTLTAVVGLLITLGVIEPFDGEDSPSAAPSPGEGTEIDRFDGVAGHFEESRALLGFLDQNDGETVYLDVGFPDHQTGPAGGENVVAETVPLEGGTSRQVVNELILVTECPSDVPIDETPAVGNGCLGTSLAIDGAQTDDSGSFFEHGVPVIQGHFSVDVTGALHMGVSPILLRPVSLEEATGA